MTVTLSLLTSIYLTAAILNSIGLYQFIPTPAALLLVATVSIITFTVFVRRKLENYQLAIIAVFLLIYIYSILLSPFPTTSLDIVARSFCAGLFFIALTHIDRRSIVNGAKNAFFFFSILQALTLIAFYLLQPDRTTGLMDDYSQASMFLLLAYVMAYPLHKNKVYFPAFSLLIFVAIFTTFSRTTNFLVIIFLVAVFVYEFNKNNKQHAYKLLITMLVAVSFVYIYPQLIGESTVDRRGLVELSTLNSRTIYWQTAWQAILNKPLLGNGLGLFSWTGINETQPFNIIYFVHNDYLEILHDLGFIWFVILFGPFFYLLAKHQPLIINIRKGIDLSINSEDQHKYFAWCALTLVALYMCINFLITAPQFQLAIAILLSDLMHNKTR